MDSQLSIISYMVPHRNALNRSKYHVCVCVFAVNSSLCGWGQVVCHSNWWVGGVIANSNKDSNYLWHRWRFISITLTSSLSHTLSSSPLLFLLLLYHHHHHHLLHHHQQQQHQHHHCLCFCFPFSYLYDTLFITV